MKQLKKTINQIANAYTKGAMQLIEKTVQEETGREIEVLSLSPIEYRFLDEVKVYLLQTVLYNTKHYKIYRGREEYCLRCHDYGMTVNEYGKIVTYNDTDYKVVGFYENTMSGYFLLMGKRGGLYITKAEDVSFTAENNSFQVERKGRKTAYEKAMDAIAQAEARLAAESNQ